jgi:hypothetical protein
MLCKNLNGNTRTQIISGFFGQRGCNIMIRTKTHIKGCKELKNKLLWRRTQVLRYVTVTGKLFVGSYDREGFMRPGDA